jgi:hypothetical protein
VRGARWALQSHSGHSFGTIRCGRHEPPCGLTVLSTSGDVSGSVTGGIIREKLRKCGMRGGASTQVTPNALVALTMAERLTQAAIRLRRSEHLTRRGETALERALEVEGETSEQLLDEAEAAMVFASAEATAAWPDAHRYGLGDPWPPDEGVAVLERAIRAKLLIARAGKESLDNPEEFEARLAAVESELPPEEG